MTLRNAPLAAVAALTLALSGAALAQDGTATDQATPASPAPAGTPAPQPGAGGTAGTTTTSEAPTAPGQTGTGANQSGTTGAEAPTDTPTNAAEAPLTAEPQTDEPQAVPPQTAEPAAEPTAPEGEAATAAENAAPLPEAGASETASQPAPDSAGETPAMDEDQAPAADAPAAAAPEAPAPDASAETAGEQPAAAETAAEAATEPAAGEAAGQTGTVVETPAPAAEAAADTPVESGGEPPAEPPAPGEAAGGHAEAEGEAAGGHAAPHIEDISFSFEGPFGRFDQFQLQRGLQVYTEVCSACHGLRYVPLRTLGDPGGPGLPEDQVRAYAANLTIMDAETGEERPRTPTDHFPTVSGEGMGPDLSLMAKGRAGFHGPYGSGLSQLFRGIGGPEYIHAILVGYNGEEKEEAGSTFYHNAAFSTGWIKMPPPLSDGQVTYEDGTEASVDQMARDVAAFLMWTAEPKMMDRKQVGFVSVIFLIVLASLLYLTNKKLWWPIKHGTRKPE